jgi:hypothetical protein
MRLVHVKKTRLAIFIMLWLSEWMIFMSMSVIPISPTRCCNHVTSFGLLVDDALYSTLVDDNVIVGSLELQVIGLSMSWKIKPITDFLLVHPQFKSMHIEWKRLRFPSLYKIPISCVPFKYLSIYVCNLKIRFSRSTHILSY